MGVMGSLGEAVGILVGTPYKLFSTPVCSPPSPPLPPLPSSLFSLLPPSFLSPSPLSSSSSSLPPLSPLPPSYLPSSSLPPLPPSYLPLSSLSCPSSSSSPSLLPPSLLSLLSLLSFPGCRQRSATLFSSSRDYPFSLGQHQHLVQYLTAVSPLSTMQMVSIHTVGGQSIGGGAKLPGRLVMSKFANKGLVVPLIFF